MYQPDVCVSLLVCGEVLCVIAVMFVFSHILYFIVCYFIIFSLLCVCFHPAFLCLCAYSDFFVSFSSHHLVCVCVCVCVTITANVESNRQAEPQSDNKSGTHTVSFNLSHCLAF